MKYTEAVANRILKLLDEKGISKTELAEKSGVSPSTLARILNQKNSKPYISTLHAICAALDITFLEFYSGLKYDKSPNSKQK